ncbi:hypothetical protein [Lactobacillus kefiranofaciens]|uniref:ABC transporter permease n=2 Tax=Lactobacillus kefiranofaciens TaxID=267818 RepID=A0AAX3UD00_9LACO|nr:hypothetical protein [Lactobacillus kefiranofaciens]AEG41109.1 Hypothetical protein WANG_1414 [Lactobacillus kefiranofaciens subsp. kefiranofaciens]KRL28885.1 hypothetical protein FC94_GL000448 [Lactobacillus kefiranofaciens subsp. kefirgranum DSM 10550 = JCM 8572]KRM20405.1 hypothetical protein FC93_GL001646 [Lactobacillus kefiranofaciens subsp. kefiranofaciens DSM 5016 = JCM 6985]MCJ2172877.1 hypothetical protein [Lactobacillus kefiranofaciens]MCP9330589.1 hypothetical protein [Lactobacil
MDGHMNKKELTHWMHMRKYRKYILYAELVYVFILLITLLYNFSLFMHLIVFQGIAIFAYLVIGWIFDRGDPIFRYRKRDTFWESVTSIRITKMFVLRFFEMILFIASVGIAGAFTRELFADLFRKTLKGSMASLIENVWLYGDFICALLMLALAISILQGSKKAIRILSWLAFVPI